jgi:peptidyl-prolyl cis-trans isomerase SurA
MKALLQMATTKISRAGLGAAIALCAALGVSSASAQAVIATVNDDPITNVDIEQHARMLRVLRKPATNEAALQDVINTRLKLIETTKFKISPGPSEVGWALGFPARELKMEPQQLLAAIQKAGVTTDEVQQKFKAEAAWMMYIKALNRTLEVSEADVRAENAKLNGKSVQYTIRQVIFVLPNGAGGAQIAERAKNAAALRAKFNDCTTGSELVRGMQDGVMKSPVTRSSSALQPALKQLLEKTPVGHLTPPQRGQEGIEMLAVCAKSDREDNEAMDTVRGDLLMKRLQVVSDKRFAEVKSRAVIVKK